MYYVTHQVTRFWEDPRQMPGTAIRQLSGYLWVTRNDGLILDPNRAKSFERYADA